MGKTIIDKWYEGASAEDRAKYDAIAAERKRQWEAEQTAKGLTKQTTADGREMWVDQAGANDLQQEKDNIAAAQPPDTFGAVERELARARTQLMIQSTNGQAGSVLGIGGSDFNGVRSNKRITGARDDRFLRAQMNPNANQNQQRAMSAFNFPLLGAAKRGAFR